MTAPNVIWVTHEDTGASFSGSFRAFRASSLDHGDDFPRYIRADAPELGALVDAAKAMKSHLDKWLETGEIATADESRALYEGLASAIASYEAIATSL